jgi:cell division protein FtsQ
LCAGGFTCAYCTHLTVKTGPLGGYEAGKKFTTMGIQDNIRKMLFITGWCILGAGMLVLLVAAIKRRNNKTCQGYRIEIGGPSGRFFIDKKDVLKILADSTGLKPVGRPLSSFDLLAMEEKLKKNPWVKSTQVFFDNNDFLSISIIQREPVARIFTVGGNSFYIDSGGAQLPLSDKETVMLPIFTGYPLEKIKPAPSDGALLKQIKNVDAFIRKDSFWSAQIAQVDITPGLTFEMVPVVGSHLIEFGDGNDVEKKFRRLFVFYRKVLSKVGFDKYARINVAFEDEVIGTKRGGLMKKSDSLQAAKNIALMIRSAQQIQVDTVKDRAMKPLENLHPDKSFRSGDLEDSTKKNP